MYSIHTTNTYHNTCQYIVRVLASIALQYMPIRAYSNHRWGREEVERTCPAAPPPPGQEISSPPTAAAAASTPACSVVSVRASASSDARCGAALCARRVLIYAIPTRIHKTDSDKLTDSDK